ncbi:MAG: TolC family protein [Methylophilaceae bacterium]
MNIASLARTMLNQQKILLAVLLCLAILGCSTAQPAKPLDSSATTTKILSKDPNSAVFKHYLIKHGHIEQGLPFTYWGLDELTLAALFFHTKLDVAKKQLTLANLGIATAGIKSKPSINADMAHSNQRNDDIKPWSYGLSVDIPIETASKREIRIEKAQKSAEAARMDVAEVAWQLRDQIAVDLIAYHQNKAETKLLEEALAIQAHIAKMLEKRVDAGITSKTELSHASLLALKTEHALNKKHAQFNLIKVKLAADVGLSPEKFESIRIKPLALVETLAHQAEALNKPLASKALQTEALLNRIDIRRSIANYAAAEAEIKLQVAKQTPDITLSPGILFDFGDSVWSLGFSSLLNSLNKNTALIEEAKQLREIQGAQFEHLQAETIAQLNQAHVRYDSAKQTSQQAEVQHTQQLKQMQKMEKQFNAGLIGKVDLKKFTLNTIVAKQQVLASKFELLKVANQIENVMQKPIYTPFNMPKFNDK